MITMGGFSLPSRTIREMICASVDVVIQAARLRDGSRKITHITEVMGMEGDVIITQDLFIYDMTGEDADGNILGRHRSTGIGRPRFWDRARYYGEEKRLADRARRRGSRQRSHAGLAAPWTTIAVFFLASARRRRRGLRIPLSDPVRRSAKPSSAWRTSPRPRR